jgi:hypothetical protein
MPDDLESIPLDDREEQKWLKVVKQAFDTALKGQPPQISRSQVESLIIGLRSNVATPKGERVLKMLQSYLDFMKVKHRTFMKVVSESFM